METFVILAPGLRVTAAGATRVGDAEAPQDARWMRSYVVEGEDGKLGTACIYKASGAQAIPEQAPRADRPVDEIFPVFDVVSVREAPGNCRKTDMTKE